MHAKLAVLTIPTLLLHKTSPSIVIAAGVPRKDIIIQITQKAN